MISDIDRCLYCMKRVYKDKKLKVKKDNSETGKQDALVLCAAY